MTGSNRRPSRLALGETGCSEPAERNAQLFRIHTKKTIKIFDGFSASWELTGSNRRPSRLALGETGCSEPAERNAQLFRIHTKKTIKIFDGFSASWELTGSNRRPSACKADALNQLS